MPPTAPPSSDPDVAVDEFLLLFPGLKEHRGKLLEIASSAWRGEPPPIFFQNFSLTLLRVPWLQNYLSKTISPELIEALRHLAFRGTGSYLRGTQRRKDRYEPPELKSPSWQFDGLLLLSKLHWGPAVNAQAQELLARSLDKIARTRGHHLKKLFRELTRSQTIEAFASQFAALLPKIHAEYPRFGRFLHDAFLPLLCGATTIWNPPDDFGDGDLLDVDKGPQSPAPEAGAVQGSADVASVGAVQLLVPQPKLSPFTASNLPDEMVLIARELGSVKDELGNLARAWRQEPTWEFFETVGRLQYRLLWLAPQLEKWARTEVFSSLRSATKSIRRHNYAFERVREWRERNYLEPVPLGLRPTYALYSPRDSRERQGVDHLRGLLLHARLEWGPEENASAQDALAALIVDLSDRVQAELPPDQFESRWKPRHPVEDVLDRVGRPKTVSQLILKIEELLPEISALHPDAARLLGDAFLPLLKGAPIVWRTDPPRVRGGRPKARARSKRIRIPGRERSQPGESPEETSQEIVVYQKGEPEQKSCSLKQELGWVRQHVWGTNPLLIRDHFQSLCDAEARIFARELDSQISSDIDSQQPDKARTGILVALTLLTGQGPRTWARAAVHETNPETPTGNKPRLLLHKGIIELPVFRPENAFRASELNRRILEPVGTTIRLFLPPTLQARILRLFEIAPGGWSTDEVELKRSLNDYVAQIATRVGTGINLARVRNFARARFREVTNDTAMTMLMCGDTFGLSTAPLYYYNGKVRDIERSFQKAMWPLFGDVPNTAPEGDDGTRIGSELLVTSATARDLARSPGARMHAASRKKLEAEFLVTGHNCLVNHFLCVLLGVACHRPTSALVDLTRFCFEPRLHSAVFGDKQSDPSHMFRHAAVADLVSVQHEHYLCHLRRLCELPNIPAQTLDQARRALHGEGPFFFHLQEDANPQLIDVSVCLKSLPEIWSKLPPNWGRTWLASRGREAGINADHLAIALGHLDATGYPFSRESPMEPAALSRAMAPSLGLVARSAGWVARKGLRSMASGASTLAELGPLKDWGSEQSELASQARAFQVEQRLVLRSHLRSKKEEGEGIAYSALQAVIPSPIPSFIQLFGRRRDKEPKAEPATEQSTVELAIEHLEQVQNKIDEATKRDRVVSISAHNALHRYLKAACKRLRWKSPIPGPWLAPPTQEATPFFPGMFRATAQIGALRDHFGSIPSKPPAGSGFTEFQWACGIAFIALCIFGFQKNVDEILGILRCRRSRSRSNAIRDLLLIEVDDERRVVGVRGLAAVALARLTRDFPQESLPDEKSLRDVLAAQIPPSLVGSPDGLTSRLCATVAISNIVELSGLARAALERKGGCVAMSAVRQRQLLEEGYGAADGVPATSSHSLNGSSTTMPSRKSAPSLARKQYKELIATLHIGEGPKPFDLTSTTLSQANITAFRGPLRRELEAFLAQGDLSPLVYCIAAFALHLTTEGTRAKREPAWSTVYSYVTSFGSELVELAANGDFAHLEPEDYLDLYQDVIDSKSSSKRKATAGRELVDFHTYLNEHHDFEMVDFSDLEEVNDRPEFQVDAEVIQPQEFLLGLRQLAALTSVSNSGPVDEPERMRLRRQAEVFALLLRGSGARHNELAALRFKDVLATPESLVLLIRPSRYRRLKTPAARRIVDLTFRLTRRQRQTICEWLVAEKHKLGASWKQTLPIFGRAGSPKERVAASDLRDITLASMDAFVGYRSKIHRARHLVAAEDMLATWLSDDDWRALRLVRAHARRLVRGSRRHAVVLPRHIREQSLRFGHRRSSTTLTNYFHMPWALVSRASCALDVYADRHVGAVALGISVAGADKIIQRNKKQPLKVESKAPILAWLAHVSGTPSATPGQSCERVPTGPRPTSNLGARSIEKVLRDIQRGLSEKETCLVNGLTLAQLHRLKLGAVEVASRTGFRIWPSPSAKGKPRSVRAFQDTKVLDGILDLLDRDAADADRQMVVSLARIYMTWAVKGKRDQLLWPRREAARLKSFLQKYGISESKIVISESVEDTQRVGIQIARSEKGSLNNALAWLLAVAYIADAAMSPTDTV